MKSSSVSSFHANSTDVFLNENDSQKQVEDTLSLNIDESTVSIKSYVDIDVQNKIESLYAEIVYEAKNEPVLTLYQQNFEFIYHLVKALMENETKLKNLIVKHRSNIEELTNKFNKSLELSSTDSRTIAKLRNDIENSWRIAHIANQKERRTRETVSAMKLEISNLSKLVEQGVGLTMGQEYNIHQILKKNENLNDENVKLKEDIESLSKQLNDFKNQEDQLEIFKNETNIKLQLAEREITSLRLELQYENRKVEKANNQIKALNDSLKAREIEIIKINHTIELKNNEISELKLKNKDYEEFIEKLRNEIDIQTGRIQNFQRESYQTGIRNEALIDEKHQLLQKIKTQDLSIETLNNHIASASRIKEINEKKTKQLEESLKDINNQSMLKNSEIEILNRELENANYHKEKSKNLIDKYIIERDQKDKKLQIIQNKTNKFKNFIREKARERDFYDKKIREQNNHIENFEVRLRNYEKQIVNKEHELKKMTEQLTELLEESKLKDSSFTEYEKQINEGIFKLEKMESLYENLKSDRNLISKELIANKEEKESLKKQIIILKNQQALLITSKQGTENDLKKIKTEYSSIEKERDNLKIKIDQMQKQLTLSHQVTNNLQIEQKKLVSLLANTDKETKYQNKENQTLAVERSILASQIVRRNDEISLLYEKIKLLKLTLRRGEKMYSVRFNDIRILKREVIRLRGILSNQNKDNNLNLKLKNELRHTEKALLNEKAKCKALEQLKGKINIPRLRKLEICDPAKYELIIKVQSLQKRLILKYEEISNLEIKFQEKDKIFFELKKHFSKYQFLDVNVLEEKNIVNKKIRKLKVFFVFLLMNFSKLKIRILRD